MTIQPECSAFEFLSSTAAPTPSPSSIRIRVPTNSAKYACTSSSSLERTTRRDVARRLQVPFHVLVELEERHAEARHLERGHVLADVGHLVYIHSLALQGIGEVGVSYVELHERRAAEAVDHHSDVPLRKVHAVTEDLLQELIHDPVGGFYLLALGARLAVDPHPDLHLVVPDLEDRLARLGRDAAGKRHPHRAHVAIDPLGDLLYTR